MKDRFDAGFFGLGRYLRGLQQIMHLRIGHGFLIQRLNQRLLVAPGKVSQLKLIEDRATGLDRQSPPFQQSRSIALTKDAQRSTGVSQLVREIQQRRDSRAISSISR